MIEKTVPKMRALEILRKYWQWNWFFRADGSLEMLNRKHTRKITVLEIDWKGFKGG